MNKVLLNMTSDHQESLKLSKVYNVDISLLKEHPLNSIFNHDEKDIEILIADIQKRGILVPLIIKDDYTILAGHNRLRVAKILNIPNVPAQKVQSHISPEIEREILFKDNIIRRQLKYKNKKEIIKALYSEEIKNDFRGAFLKNQGLNPRSSTELYMTLPLRIEKEIGIPVGTAKRIIAELRKEENGEVTEKSILKRFTKHLSSIEKLLSEQDKDFRKIAKKQIIQLINHL